MDALKSFALGAGTLGGILLTIWVFFHFHPWPLYLLGGAAVAGACYGLGEDMRGKGPKTAGKVKTSIGMSGWEG